MEKAPEAEVKIITHRCSPFAQRVQIALLEKGISFESIIVDYSNKPELLKVTNPMWMKVPVLIHGNNAVAESLVILEYLEDAWPDLAPLMPKDAYEKAKVRFWSDYIHKELTAVIAYSKVPADGPEKQAGRDATIKFIRTLDGAMNTYSTEGPFFTGDHFGFLDVVLAPFAGVLPVLEAADSSVVPGRDEIPRYFKWDDAVRSRPSVSASLPSIQEYLVFLTELAALGSTA